MARNRLPRNLLAGALALLAVAAPGLAREDDPEFIYALADRGYGDLANREIERMLAGSPTPDKRENAEYARCQLQRRIALLAAQDDKADPKGVREKFAAAGKSYDGFLKAYAASARRAEAEFNMANLMKDFAYFLTKSKEKFPSSEQAAVAQEAGKTFEEAIRYLRAIKDREHEKDKEKPDDDETKNLDRNKAWYFLCTAMHDQAMLLPAGDALRTQQFTKAIEEGTLFLEETEGTIFGYYASWLLATMYWHRAELSKGFSSDDLKLAREMFESTVGAADIENLEQDWPALVDVIFQSATDFGTMCNQAGTWDGTPYPKVFAERVTVIEGKLPSIRKHRYGLRLLIEKARAMAATGNGEKAVALLNQVSEWTQGQDQTWGRAVDQEAKKALNEVLASSPAGVDSGLGPDVLFKAGEGSVREGDFGRAVRTFQRVLLAVEREPDPAKRKTLAAEYSGRCWLQINECYARMDRWLEAYYAADHLVQRYLAERRTDQDEEIGNLARYRATALESCLKALPKDAPKEVRDEFVDRIKKARELLTERFPDIGGGSVAYQVAMGKLAAATTLSATDKARAAVLFKDAIDLFNRVEPKDPMRKFAQVRIGECMVQMGKPAEARKHLEAFVADAANQEDWKVGPPRGRQPWAWAVFWIAMSLDAEKQPAKAIESLEDFEKRFAGASVEVLVPRVRYVRILALTDPAVGRGAEGEDEVARLLKDSPDSPYVPGAAVRVAADLIKRSAKARTSGDTKVAGECQKRAADLYDFWVRRTPNVPPEQLTFVGQIFFDIANFDRAAELWQSALEIHRKGGNAAEVEKITISLASLLVGQKRYAEALPKFEALFIRTPEDATLLRAVFEEMKRPISNVPKEAQQERNRKLLAAVADALAKDPDGASGVDQVRKAIPELQTEAIVRAYVDKPEHRLALARALALTLLGNDAAILPGLRAAVFDLVRRSPDLMSNLARCYEELANQDMQYPIRAVNLYNLLVDSAPDEPGVPGAKYTERWFDWKYRWAKVYLDTGRTLKQESWLRVVCAIVKGMATLGEDKRADQERAGLSKEFENLRNQADEALKALGKEGCK